MLGKINLKTQTTIQDVPELMASEESFVEQELAKIFCRIWDILNSMLFVLEWGFYLESVELIAALLERSEIHDHTLNIETACVSPVKSLIFKCFLPLPLTVYSLFAS
jgi:hypothetical protein